MAIAEMAMAIWKAVTAEASGTCLPRCASELLFIFFCFFSDIRLFAFVPGDIGAVIFDAAIGPGVVPGTGFPQREEDLVGIDGNLLFQVLRLVEIPLIGGLGPLDQRFVGMVSGQQPRHCGQHGHQRGGKGDIKRPLLALLFRLFLDLLIRCSVGISISSGIVTC